MKVNRFTEEAGSGRKSSPNPVKVQNNPMGVIQQLIPDASWQPIYVGVLTRRVWSIRPAPQSEPCGPSPATSASGLGASPACRFGHHTAHRTLCAASDASHTSPSVPGPAWKTCNRLWIWNQLPLNLKECVHANTGTGCQVHRHHSAETPKSKSIPANPQAQSSSIQRLTQAVRTDSYRHIVRSSWFRRGSTSLWLITGMARSKVSGKRR